MYKLLLPYDIYERHRKIGSYIKEHDTVLDIGGELNHLSFFCKPSKLVVANITGGDVVIKKNKLPFASKSFSTVCSIDVIEHIPKKERFNFIKRLIDTTSSKVILSFPLGTEEHIINEKQLLKWLERNKQKIGYLKEHARYGLPTTEEVKDLIKGYHSDIFYSGNIQVNNFLFRVYMFDPKIKYIRRFVYLLKLVFNLVSNNILYSMLANKPFSSKINRIYIIIER